MKEKIPGDYIKDIIINIGNDKISRNIFIDHEIGYVRTFVSGFIDEKEKDTTKTLIKTNIGYIIKRDALFREISILSEKLKKAKKSNDLLAIKICLNSIVLKYKELIDCISLHGSEEEKKTIKDLNNKLSGYILEEEKYDLLYKKFTEFILEFSEVESEYEKLISGFNLSYESLVSLSLKLKSVILKSNNFIRFLNKNEVDKLDNMILKVTQILFTYNSRNRSSSNSKNRTDTNLSFEDALNIFGLTREELNLDILKNSYREKASKLHPDKNPGKDTNEEMSRLNQARDLLERYLE